MERRRRLSGPLIAAFGAHALFAVVFAYGGRPFRPPAESRAMEVFIAPDVIRSRPQRVAPPDTGRLRSESSRIPQTPSQPATEPGPADEQTALGSQPSTEDGAAANLRAALRASVGCAQADEMRLTPAERDRCAERRIAWGRAATPIAAPMDPDKRAFFAAVAAAYDQQTHGPPMAGRYVGVGCSVKFSGLAIVKAKPPANSLSLGPCFISPPQGFLTEESGIERR